MENEILVWVDIKIIFYDKNYNRIIKSLLRVICSGKFWDLVVFIVMFYWYNKYFGSCIFCCGRFSGLLCWFRGVGKENFESILWKDIFGKCEVNFFISGDDLEKKCLIGDVWERDKDVNVSE